MEKDYRKEPYEIIEKKLEIADLSLELSSVTREKWRLHNDMRVILEKEEALLKRIDGHVHELAALLSKV